MLKLFDSFFVFTFIARVHISIQMGYLQGKNKQLGQNKASHKNMAARIGGNVFYVPRISNRERVIEQFIIEITIQKHVNIYGYLDR